MRKAFGLFLLAVFASLNAVAKEDCWGYAQLQITRANGDIEDLNFNDAPTILLGQSDSATLKFGFVSGTWCYESRYLVYQNGEVIMDSPPAIFLDFDVTSPGFYDDTATGIDFFGTGPFFIVNGISPPLLLDVKAWLQAAFDEDSGLMRDDLRTTGELPFGNDLIPIDSATMAITGQDAIVDRAFVELRLANSPQTICGTRSGLLQRDGDIVAADGHSPLSFTTPPGEYFVVVGHRNHLRAMTADPIALDSAPVTLDFRDPDFPTYGTDARKIEGDAALLWAGNAGSGKSISYTGNNNDRDAILQQLGSMPMNSISHYSSADVNMDGVVKYTGANNDRDALLLYLGSTVATTVRVEQVP